jgi:hypothetical protein
VDHSHSLWHIGARPEGCHHQPRLCLLKGCERLFWPQHWRSHYCSAACRQAARLWRRWRASEQYRATENGKQQRREQSKRYRERQREQQARQREQQATSADAAGPREGQRISPAGEDFPARPCRRPGCYEVFVLPHEQSCKCFCSMACRLALRRVLDREARYQARRRHRRCARGTKPARPPDTS